MTFIIYTATCLLIIYAVLIACYHVWWNRIPVDDIPVAAERKAGLKVSVIIPARNEQDTILHRLRSLASQSYPADLLEILVVDDHSTDRTAAVVKDFPATNVRLLDLSQYVLESINSYKKKAIEIAIRESTGQLMVTTDADCTAGRDWIAALVACCKHRNAVFIAAGVKINTNGSLLSVFQSLDFLTLQGITGASVHQGFHSMCNGANMAYLKTAFYEVEGFQGIDHIASGDDMLLMHKISQRYPERVFFLKNKEAIVYTQPETNWRSFLNQRIRWASKADKYDDKRIFVVLLLVYLLNLFLLICLVVAVFYPSWWRYALLLVGGKFLSEIGFLYTIAGFFSMRKWLLWFPFLQPLHLLYTVVAGFLGKFGTYNWKGRKVN